MSARTAAVPLLLTALLSACAAGVEDDVAGAPEPAPASAAPAPSQAPAPTQASAASPTPAVRTIAAAYAEGQVTGTSGREQVARGEAVVLRISSDVAEEVHVHGYDLEQPVPAGGSVDIPVEADIPGVFEVELHESGKVLFQLRVA